MIRTSANYYWAKMTSGVFMLASIGYLSKPNYVNSLYC